MKSERGAKLKLFGHIKDVKKEMPKNIETPETEQNADYQEGDVLTYSEMLEAIQNVEELTLVESRKLNVICEKIASLHDILTTKAAKEAIKEEEKKQALFLKERFSKLSYEEKERLFALVAKETEGQTEEQTEEQEA